MDWKQRFAEKPKNPQEIVAYQFEKDGKPCIAPAKDFEWHLEELRAAGKEPEPFTPLTRKYCQENKLRFTP